MRGFEVVDPGLLTTVQDAGRPGFAHLGVPRSGAVDRAARALGNRLVGNPESAAVLETTLSDVRLRARGSLIVAVTGAGAPVWIDSQAVSWGSPLHVSDGAVLRVGAPYVGARSLVAVAGGVAARPELGSRSTDLLSGLGPAPLREGDVVPVGEAVGEPQWVEAAPVAPLRELRLEPGPHRDWCDAAAFDGGQWTVGADSNRVGLRLEGVVVTRREGEIASFGVVAGAIQLPPAGPVILLADHATTGGYPVVAVVRDEDLDGCGQLRPGDRIVTRWAHP